MKIWKPQSLRKNLAQKQRPKHLEELYRLQSITPDKCLSYLNTGASRNSIV